jgi:photosystem II stability/assembly factor-like uncharacterized protein
LVDAPEVLLWHGFIKQPLLFAMRTFIIVTCLFAVMFASRQAIVATSIAATPDHCVAHMTPTKTKPIPDQARTLLRSSNDGRTWEDLSVELPVTVRSPIMGAKDNQVHISVGSMLYEGVGAPSALSWAKHETNLNVEVNNLIYGQSEIFISSYNNGLFKELTKGSGIWLSVVGDLPDLTIRTFCEHSNGHLLVGTQSGVYRSIDGGGHWDKVLARSEVNNVIEADGVLICTYYTGISRSTDGGATWEAVFSQPKTFPFQVHQGTNGLIGLIEDQQEDFGKNTNRLARSNDGGKTWKFETLGLDQENLQIGDFLQIGQTLLLSHSKGISRSTDGGKTWELMYPLAEEGNYRLIRDGNMIYAAYFLGC